MDGKLRKKKRNKHDSQVSSLSNWWTEELFTEVVLEVVGVPDHFTGHYTPLPNTRKLPSAKQNPGAASGRRSHPPEIFS